MNTNKLFCKLKKPSVADPDGLMEILGFIERNNFTFAICALLYDNEVYKNLIKDGKISKEECVKKYGSVNDCFYKGKIYVAKNVDIYLVNPIDDVSGVMEYNATSNTID